MLAYYHILLLFSVYEVLLKSLLVEVEDVAKTHYEKDYDLTNKQVKGSINLMDDKEPFMQPKFTKNSCK